MPAPERIQPRLRTLLHVGLLGTVLSASIAFAASTPLAVSAQSATPTAASSDCKPPVFVPQPDIPAEVASPGIGTPAAVLGADAATGEQIETLVDSLAACLTAGNFETVAELVTDRYIGDAYGAGERMTRQDYLALAPLAPIIPVTVVSIGQIEFTGNDTAAAQVVTIQGNQLRTEEWTFLYRRNRQAVGTPAAGAGEGRWLVHQVTVLPSAAPLDAAEMKAVQKDYSLSLTGAKIARGDLVVTIQNNGKETHEFLALKFDKGASVDQLIRPTSDTFPANIHVIGQETVPPGQTRTLILVDLEPGTYTVVCLLPDADGVPHLALGETATFEVS